MRTETETTGPLPSHDDLGQPLRRFEGSRSTERGALGRDVAVGAGGAPKKRRLWFVLGCVVVALLGIGAGIYVGVPGLVERAGQRALIRLEDRFGVRVDAREVTWTWGGNVAATGVVVRATGSDEVLATVESLQIDSEVDFWARHVRVVRVALGKPVLKVTRDAAGHTNLDGLIAAFSKAKSGGGAVGGGVTIAPEVPIIVMDDATLALDAVLPSLPFGLTLPGRAAFEQGKVTIRPTGPPSDGHLATTPMRVEVAFASTSLDPGQGLSFVAEGPLMGVPQRVEVKPTRPMRFWLRDRVLGVGGVALTEEGIELGPLQLSVPIAKGASEVAAAASCEKIVVASKGAGGEAFVRELLDKLARGNVLAVIGALERVRVVRPVVSLNFDEAGHHDFVDLLPPSTELASLGLVEPRELDLVAVMNAANVAASDRLLAPAPSAPKPGEVAVRPLWERFAGPFMALDKLSRRRVPGIARAFVPLPVKAIEVVDGELLLGSPGVQATLTGVALEVSHDGARREVKATVASIDVGAATKPKLVFAARLDGDKLHLEVETNDVPVRLVQALMGPVEGKERPLMAAVGDIAELAFVFDGDIAGTAWDLSGKVAVRGAELFHASIAGQPLTNVDAQLQGAVRWDGPAGRFTLTDGVVQSRGVVVHGSVDVADALHKPKLRLQAELSETPVQRLVDAIPTGFAPLLEGLRMDGMLRWPVVVDLDTTSPETVRVDSRPDARGLQVLTLGNKVDFNALRGQHAYGILLADGTAGQRMVGPMTGSWVPLGGITPYLPLALTTTEDGTFYSNDGISTRAMLESIATNLARGGFVRGASTLTQQLVKNLYLGGTKTISRKLQEVFIAWQMAQQMSKDEVMALYLNAIEFGPGIYGIGDAAWHWFGKRPLDLTLTEAIFLASIIPGPRKYYSFFTQGAVTPRWSQYLEALLKIMVERGKITEQELVGAAPYVPQFRGAGGGYTDEPPPAGFDELPEDDDIPDE